LCQRWHLIEIFGSGVIGEGHLPPCSPSSSAPGIVTAQHCLPPQNNILLPPRLGRGWNGVRAAAASSSVDKARRDCAWLWASSFTVSLPAAEPWSKQPADGAAWRGLASTVPLPAVETRRCDDPEGYGRRTRRRVGAGMGMRKRWPQEWRTYRPPGPVFSAARARL
jgi:hypothetical protein